MEAFLIYFIVLGASSGFTKGDGMLPEGPLNKAVGETVMFTTTLTPSETPLLVVSWTFNRNVNIITSSNANITGPQYEGRITLFTSTGSLELRNLVLNDSGEYTVSILPAGEVSKLGVTTLAVYEKVSNVLVTSSSTDLVEFNSSVTLSCSASGSTYSFIWLNGSSEVTASDRVQLTNGGSNLTIINVTRFDEGPFKCRVSNPVSTVTSDPVNLSISYGPENVILSPPQGYFAVGSDISLTCSVGSRPPAQFKWFLNGNELPDTGSELRLMNVQMSQSGNYSCQAFNGKTLRSQTSQPSAITVLEKISGASILLKSSTNLPAEGTSVSLSCEASGSVFTRNWIKDGSKLTLTDNMTLSYNNRVLTFYTLKRKDEGEYFCNISNPISSDGYKYVLIVNYQSSECAAGCIAGIVIACFIVAGVCGIGYYFYRRTNKNPQTHNTEQGAHVYENTI